MGTLASELRPHVDKGAPTPRVYVNANVPLRVDDRRFPTRERGGVVVLTAPIDDGLLKILRRLDWELLRGAAETGGLPLDGRKWHLHVDWTGQEPRP